MANIYQRPTIRACLKYLCADLIQFAALASLLGFPPSHSALDCKNNTTQRNLISHVQTNRTLLEAKVLYRTPINLFFPKSVQWCRVCVSWFLRFTSQCEHKALGNSPNGIIFRINGVLAKEIWKFKFSAVELPVINFHESTSCK